VADTIAYFAKAVKEETNGRALVGTFYGYTMELNNNGPRALAHSGHLALARLLDCPHVDLIHAPYSYFERAIGQPGHLHLPGDSLAVHGKLGMFEEDTYTHLGAAPKEGVIAPGWRERTTSLEETLAVSRRNFANFFTHRCGLWFFDLLSDGRWNDAEFWDTAPLFRRMAAELRGETPFRPEIAVAINETAVHLMRATTHPYLQHALAHWRAELGRLGTPVGYYLQSDLPKLPNSVKVLILPNALHLTREEEHAVELHIERGNAVVWTYAPGLFGPEGPDSARIAQRVGMPVEARFDDVLMNIVSEPTGEKVRVGKDRWQPRFVITAEPSRKAVPGAPSDSSGPSDTSDLSDVSEPTPARRSFWADLKESLRRRPSPKTPASVEALSPSSLEILARYESTGEIAAAARPLNGGVCVYTAIPRLPVGLLRYICRNSGVHLYHDVPGMTGVLGNYLIVHTPGGPSPERPTRYTFHWPSVSQRVTRVTPSPGGTIAMETETWSDTLPPKTTAIYRCE
jgi:hypothetical protein